MTKEELIESGKLELYVTGSLPQEEIQEVRIALQEYPDLLQEIEHIEHTYKSLAEGVAPIIPDSAWENIRNSTSGIRTLPASEGSTSNWVKYTGWAAAILCMAGIFWMLKQNNDLKKTLRYNKTQNIVLQEKISDSEVELAETTDILNAIRSEEFNTVKLAGNEAVAPEAFAKVYYNEQSQIAYIDAAGLPAPPKGKVYQVWSLLIEPLTPTSAGLLASFKDSSNKIFKVEGLPITEGFGITLEPEGGSESPTLSQLYVIGTVSP